MNLVDSFWDKEEKNRSNSWDAWPRNWVTRVSHFPLWEKCGCFQKSWYPQIIHFNRVFHYKPSILGYHYFWKHPCGKSHARICQVTVREDQRSIFIAFKLGLRTLGTLGFLTAYRFLASWVGATKSIYHSYPMLLFVGPFWTWTHSY